MTDVPTVEKAGIGVEGMLHFANFHEFIGAVTARRLARTKLERGERHERLVAQSGRTVGRHAHVDTCSHQRMVGVDVRRVKAE